MRVIVRCGTLTGQERILRLTIISFGVQLPTPIVLTSFTAFHHFTKICFNLIFLSLWKRALCVWHCPASEAMKRCDGEAWTATHADAI